MKRWSCAVAVSSSVRRLLLEDAERTELAIGIENLLHGGRAEGADQLVLEVGDTHEEPQCLHVDAGEVGAETCSLEPAAHAILFGRVVHAGQAEVAPLRPQLCQEAPDGRRPTRGHDGDALCRQIATAAPRQRFERELVADALDEHDRASGDAGGQRVRGGRNQWCAQITHLPCRSRTDVVRQEATR